jgi:apolipoprotein N-acyltransferase
VLAGLALGETARRLVRGQVRAAAVPAALAVAALLTGPLAALVPPTGAGTTRTATIAAVQGNVPRLGLDFNAQRRAVLDNHVRVTEQLAADVAAGRRPRPDVVLWPENASDIDPLRNRDAAAAIDRAARAVGVPIVLGTVLAGEGGTATNSVLVWQPGSATETGGVVARTDKRRVQPFGEYLPWRSFFRLLSPYADRAGNFVPGTGAGAVDAAGIRVGIAICWEIAFDDLVADSVAAGAQVLAVPSNNATFGLTDMTFQQLAMSRVRAVEHDRAVLVVTTSGVSATIAPDGTVTAATSRFTPDVLVDATPLRATTTLAGRLRALPEWVLLATGLAGAGAAVYARRRERAGEDEDG